MPTKKSSMNLPQALINDMRDWIALHPDGPQSLTELAIQAIEAKVARDRPKIEALRRLREDKSDK